MGKCHSVTVFVVLWLISYMFFIYSKSNTTPNLLDYLSEAFQSLC